MKSRSSRVAISGGESWITGSPRSSARQIRPASYSAPRQEPAQQVLGLVVGERLLGLLVLDQLERHEVPGAAHVADDRLLAELVQHAAEVVLVLADVLEHALALHHLEVLERHGARDGMAAVGDAVVEHVRALDERGRDGVGHEHAAERDVRRADALGERDDVGADVVALGPEPVAEPAEAADDLVGDQQDAVLVADLADALAVALRRRERAARVLDGLHEHRGDRLGRLLLDLRRAARRAGTA